MKWVRPKAGPVKCYGIGLCLKHTQREQTGRDQVANAPHFIPQNKDTEMRTDSFAGQSYCEF
jgi:hypothetical protein